MTNQLNITFEVIAAYKAWEKAESTADNSNAKIVLYGKTGSKEERKAVKLAHGRFIKSVLEAGNSGDWDADRIIGKLSNQPSGLTYLV